jgi:hypothetical protein
MLRPTVSWPVCLGVKHPSGAGLLMWGALSDERMGLPFTTAAGSRQRSHSWVRVPRDSWPYFTVSDSRLHQPGRPRPRICIPQALGSLVVASRVRVRVTFRLEAYRQSVRRGAEPLETHGQNFFSQLNTCGHSPYITSSLTRGWGLSFTTAAGPRQRINSRVRVPWDSRSYFTVSDSRLPFLSPPTPRRATVEAFDPASTRKWCLYTL